MTETIPNCPITFVIGRDEPVGQWVTDVLACTEPVRHGSQPVLCLGALREPVWLAAPWGCDASLRRSGDPNEYGQLEVRWVRREGLAKAAVTGGSIVA